MRPWRARTAAIAASTGTVGDVARHRPRLTAGGTDLARQRRQPVRTAREQRATRMPRAAKSRASHAPMPLEAPVTMPTVPA